MAQKRMFRLDVLETDAFMEMPLTTQALYFWLGLKADDDGFIGNPNMVTRNVGASSDDLKLLIAKGFLIQFADGVVVVKHWRMHNTLSANRYKETKYLEDKSILKIKDNKAYSLNSGNPIDDSHQIAMGSRQAEKDEQKTNNRRTIDEQKTKKDEQKTNTDKDIDIDIDLGKDKDLVRDKDLDKDIEIDNNPLCIPPLRGEESEKEPQIEKPKRKYQRKPFVPPTLDDVKKYAQEAGLDVDPKSFYDYFTVPNDAGQTWIDSEGKPVRNWKQKMQTWNRMGGGMVRTSKPKNSVADNFLEAARLLEGE